MFIYICIYIYICLYTYVYIYIFISKKYWLHSAFLPHYICRDANMYWYKTLSLYIYIYLMRCVESTACTGCKNFYHLASWQNGCRSFIPLFARCVPLHPKEPAGSQPSTTSSEQLPVRLCMCNYYQTALFMFIYVVWINTQNIHNNIQLQHEYWQTQPNNFFAQTGPALGWSLSLSELVQQKMINQKKHMVGWLVGSWSSKVGDRARTSPQQLPGVQVGHLNAAKRQTAWMKKYGECKGMQQECSVIVNARVFGRKVHDRMRKWRVCSVNIHPDWDYQIENNKSNAQIKRAQAFKRRKYPRSKHLSNQWMRKKGANQALRMSW